MFEKIDSEKKALPRLNLIADEAKKADFNIYQKYSVMFLFITLISGVLFGNIFSTCGLAGNFYQCEARQFNFSLMLIIWLGGSVISVFFFGLGNIINLLNSINNKLDKKK